MSLHVSLDLITSHVKLGRKKKSQKIESVIHDMNKHEHQNQQNKI